MAPGLRVGSGVRGFMFRIDGSKQALAQEIPIIPWKADARN